MDRLFDPVMVKIYGGGLRGHARSFYAAHKYDWGFRHWNKFYWWMHNLIDPKQKWVLNGIGRDWHDKPELLVEVMFNFIIDFVDGEKCFEAIDWEENEFHRKVAVEIKDCYDYIKNRRPVLVKEIDTIIHNDAHTILSNPFGIVAGVNDGKSYDERYLGLTKLEETLEAQDTYYMCNIVKNRAYLWT